MFNVVEPWIIYYSTIFLMNLSTNDFDSFGIQINLIRLVTQISLELHQFFTIIHKWNEFNWFGLCMLSSWLSSPLIKLKPRKTQYFTYKNRWLNYFKAIRMSERFSHASSVEHSTLEPSANQTTKYFIDKFTSQFANEILMKIAHFVALTFWRWTIRHTKQTLYDTMAMETEKFFSIIFFLSVSHLLTFLHIRIPINFKLNERSSNKKVLFICFSFLFHFLYYTKNTWFQFKRQNSLNRYSRTHSTIWRDLFVCWTNKNLYYKWINRFAIYFSTDPCRKHQTFGICIIFLF